MLDNYNGFPIKSKEELYFIYYLEELHEKGYVSDYSYEGLFYVINEKHNIVLRKLLKTKIKLK